MIKTNRYIYGIKKNNESIESDVENIIDNSQEYLVMGSYSFWLPNHIFHKLKNVAQNVSSALIVPILDRSNDLQFFEKKIKCLINANVGVIISAENHSKFVFNEKNIYYGSANLTNGGLNLNVEVITMYDSLRADLKSDFNSFVLEEINRFLGNHQKGLREINANTFTNFGRLSNMLFKLNPNILKVEKTVNNYEKCNRIIPEAIEGYYATLSSVDFNKVYRKLLVLRRSLEEVYKYGTYVLYKEGFLYKENPEEIEVASERVHRYNRLWQKFNEQLTETLNLLERLPGNLILKLEKDELMIKNYQILLQLKNKILGEMEKEVEEDNRCQHCGQILE